MMIPRVLLAVAAGLLTCFASAAPLPKSSPDTVVLTGADLATGSKVDLRKDPDALGGSFVAPRDKYQTLVRITPPAEGASLNVWIRYRDLALQMKVRRDGKTVEFPWNWQRNPKAFGWRLVGGYSRAELGDGLWFINDPKLSDASGIDALVITADTSWKPAGVATASAASPAPLPPVNPDAPDAANATVLAPVAVIEESIEPGVARVNIDWSKTGEPISPFVYSLNNFRAHSVERMSAPAWHEGHRYMGARMQRIHNAGLVRTYFNAETGTWNYDLIRASLDAGRPPAGVERMFNINGWPASYDADEDGRLDPDRIADYARLCADLVRFVNIEMKTGIRYWEITNEKDFAYWRKPRKDNQPDVPALARLYNEVAAAMRAVDPSAKYGGPAACSPLPMEPLVQFAKLAADQLDFFSFHHYATGDNKDSDQVIYEKAGIMADDADRLIRALRATLPGKSFEVYLDEFNICYSWRVPEPRMTNHKGAVFDALSLIAYSRVPGLTGTQAWNDQDRVYGKLDNEGNLRPAAHVYHHFNSKLVGVPAATTTSAPKAIVPMATLDGTPARHSFVLVNRTNAVQTVTVTQSAARSGTWKTASVDADGHHAAAPADPFAAPVALAPHSVNFYWLN